MSDFDTYADRLRADLPPPIAELAVENLDRSYYSNWSYAGSDYPPLMYGFGWSRSPQGHDFWELVHRCVCRDKLNELPPIPQK